MYNICRITDEKNKPFLCKRTRANHEIICEKILFSSSDQSEKALITKKFGIS